MKTREQLRTEDGKRFADSQFAAIMTSRLSEEEKAYMVSFYIRVLSITYTVSKTKEQAVLAGKLLAYFGNQLATLEARLDAAMAAEQLGLNDN